MSLLSDITEERAEFLLENGNLSCARLLQNPTIQSKWTGENQWTSLGYAALVTQVKCACGAIQDRLEGVFHIERTPSGTIRKTSLDLRRHQIPLIPPSPIEFTYSLIPLCAACLPKKGFSHPSEN